MAKLRSTSKDHSKKPQKRRITSEKTKSAQAPKQIQDRHEESYYSTTVAAQTEAYPFLEFNASNDEDTWSTAANYGSFSRSSIAVARKSTTTTTTTSTMTRLSDVGSGSQLDRWLCDNKRANMTFAETTLLNSRRY